MLEEKNTSKAGPVVYTLLSLNTNMTLTKSACSSHLQYHVNMEGMECLSFLPQDSPP